MAARVTGREAAGRKRRSVQVPAAARTAPARSPTAAQAARSRLFRETTMGAATPACEPAWAIQASSLLMSWALCQRSSGSLARQVRTIRSRAGGVIGASVDSGAGSADIIEEMSEAWLAPEKAFFPVTIS